jgi:hypothetical protein
MSKEHMSPVPRVERLSRLREWTVGKGETDPRGWSIVNAERRSIGEVKDLLVDTETMTAAYLDVELDRKLFDLRDDPHVLVPMARAHRDGDHRRLVVDGLTRDRVAELCMAREAHYRQFWNHWWEMDRTGAHDRDWSPRITRGASPEELRRAVDDVRPGETVRIPVVHEEIVVERRPVHSDERVMARGPDEVAPRRSREE